MCRSPRVPTSAARSLCSVTSRVDEAVSQMSGELKVVRPSASPSRLSEEQAMKPAVAAGAVLTLAMLPGCHRPPAPASAADGLTPVPAARYIVEAFDRYPLVAFSEPRHGAGGTKEFLASLIRQPGFAGTIQDLV